MKLISCLLIVFSLLYGCNNEADTIHANAVDSADKKVVAAVEPEDNRGDNPDSILEDYKSSYNKSYILDTAWLSGKDTFSFTLKHYCLMDSAVRIPKRYTEIYKLDSFITHNFETTISLEKNGHNILQRKIVKEDFNGLLDEYLKDYAVLLSPGGVTINDSVVIDYSISIPLTDVGTGVSTVIRKDGSCKFMQ